MTMSPKRHTNRGPSEFENASLVDELCNWARSLPWVIEWPAEPGESRCLTVACAPLGCRRVWLVVCPSGGVGDDPDLQVVLPRRIGHRGVAVGWGVLITELDEDRMLVGVAVPTTIAELQALEALLKVAYEAAFAPSESDTR